MTPAHTNRIALAAVISATLALGLFATIFRGPLDGGSVAAAAADRTGSRSLQGLLTDPLGAMSHPARVSEAAPTDRLLSPCRHNRREQLVTVSIEQQHAWACAGKRTVLSTPVTTGAETRHGSATPRGSFAVQALTPNTTLRPSRGGSFHVRYWIPFRFGEWGFHDASWQKIPFGSPKFAMHGSHGCVHVPLRAMRQLFHFVHPGTTVRIH
ncbi:MAG TPA: L,D-transpeptidase [Mycobacteriales bacterium]|nr:L,D-transpeptidase [Mycobacteriales bacterium]